MHGVSGTYYLRTHSTFLSRLFRLQLRWWWNASKVFSTEAMETKKNMSQLMLSTSPTTSTSYSTISTAGEDKTNHLTRTSSNTRDAEIHSVTVSALRVLSPTVREVVLTSPEIPPLFSFKAGQWVDVFIPEVATVGGFSMCSSPQELQSAGTLRLAIKYSTHPPALWMHESCKIGDKLQIRVGGDFFLTCKDDMTPRRILLVAGGVGINPLCSIVKYVQDGKYAHTVHEDTKVFLMYSAKTTSELIFKEYFDAQSCSDASFVTKYFVTGAKFHDSTTEQTTTTTGLHCRRINQIDLQTAVNFLSHSGSQYSLYPSESYICGPPPMIQDVKETLNKLQISNIFYEKWW